MRQLSDSGISSHGRRPLTFNPGKTKIMFIFGHTKYGLSKSKNDRCSICSLRVKSNSVFVWIFNGSAGMKMVSAKS